MEKRLTTLKEEEIKDKIYSIRGLQVMLDSDLAELYNVKTRRLNEQVKRNSMRFPTEFMFQLTDSEVSYLRSRFATSKNSSSLMSQFMTLEKSDDLKFQNGTSKQGGRRSLPYAFTEQGVAMLSGVLKSDTAVRMSIQIMSAFVNMRRFISSNTQMFHRLDIVEKKQIEHDTKFDEIFDALQSRGIMPDKGIFFDGQIFDSHK